MAANYYEIIGVPRTASASEVRSAYTKLARERHPDRFADAAEKARAEEFFKDLTTAFNTLTNEKHRREYDQSLDRPVAAPPQAIAQSAYPRGLQMFESKNN